MITNIKKNFSLNIFYLFLGSLIAFSFFIFFYLFYQEKKYENKIYPQVYLDNVDFSGKTKEEIIDFYQKKSEEFQDNKFVFTLEGEKISTFTASYLKMKIDGETVAKQAYLVGRSPFFLSRLYQKTVSFFSLGRFNFKSQIVYNDAPIKELLTNLKNNYDKPAKNALFKFENNRVVNFKKEENGQKINEEKTFENFKKSLLSLNSSEKTKEIIIVKEIIYPEISLSSINNFGIEELIAVGKSDFSHSISSRIHNIILAASKFHGVLIPPQKILSFNETVGDISYLTGYKQAYIIKEGKTVLGDGGGVCQVSTTLFRAALNAGLPIVERQAHAYRVSYYENDSLPGFDATVFAPYVDLKIKNDTPSYILIQTEIDKEKNLLYFYLYGKKDGRQVEISKPYLWDAVPSLSPKYQDDPTLKKGVIKQVDWGVPGIKSTFHYKVTKNNKVIFEKDFYSSYQPWADVFLVGVAD